MQWQWWAPSRGLKIVKSMSHTVSVDNGSAFVCHPLGGHALNARCPSLTFLLHCQNLPDRYSAGGDGCWRPFCRVGDAQPHVCPLAQEERASSERREIDLRVAADRMAYNLADRMASYELVLRGFRG